MASAPDATVASAPRGPRPGEEASATASPRRDVPARWSYGGLAGGLGAVGAFGVATAAEISGRGGHWLLLAILYGAIATAFVPAVIVSIVPSPRRQLVLRVETALSLALAFGLFAIDPGIAFLLTLPSVLLSTSAGLIFQGRRAKAE